MTDTTPAPDAALHRLIVAAGSAIFDDRIPSHMPAGEAAMHGVLTALPVLLREDSPAGEDLRRLGLRLETSLNNCRLCAHDQMGPEHDGHCMRDLNQRRLVSEWEDVP